MRMYAEALSPQKGVRFIAVKDGVESAQGENERFISDEEGALVVRQIYQFCLARNGPPKIARMLAE